MGAPPNAGGDPKAGAPPKAGAAPKAGVDFWGVLNELNKLPPVAGADVAVENKLPPDDVVEPNSPPVWGWDWVTLVNVAVFRIPPFPNGDFCCWAFKKC